MDRDGSLNFVGGNRGTSNGEPSAVAKKMDRDSSQKLAGGNRGTSNGEPSVFRGNQSFAAVKDKMVVVKVGDKSFPVKIVASPELVSVDWITLHLRLKPVHNRRNSVVERSFFAGPMVVGSPVSEKRGQLDREEVPIERDLWVPEKTIRESIFAHPPSSGVGNGLSGLLVGPLGNTSQDKAVMKKHGSNYKGNQDKQDEGILKAQPVDNALSDGVDPNNLVRSDEDPDNKVSEVGNQTVNNFQGVSSETESEKGIESRGINLYVDLSGQGGEILMATSDAQSQGGLDSGRMADDDSNQNRNTRCVERETTLEISKVKSIATGRKS
ncbi:hypothetical protein Q3G72_024523 [Acer saccharum]|nr:hypothetical protein Q3G72_024523 [Acer saccharum]